MASLLPARRRRQAVIVVFVFAVLCYITYTRSALTFTAPDHENHTHPPPSPTLLTPEHLPAVYGTTARPPFKDLILQGSLPQKYLPKLETDKPDDKHEGKRLIFIGDVHGMLGPLKELLQKISFDAAGGDHVIFTGDMVMKGPDSVGVVDYAMEIGASAVRGNHEDRVLLAAQQLDLERRRRKHQHKKTKSEGSEEEQAKEESDEDYQYALTDPMEEEHFSHGDDKDRNVARRLSTHQLTWLASLPVILNVGHLPPMGDVVTVHAGLVPGVPLDKQDPWAVMNMRTLLYLGDELRVEFARQAVESARRALEPNEDKKERINVGPKETEVQDLAMRDRKDWDNDVFVPVASREGERWTKVWEKAMRKLAKDARKADAEDDGATATKKDHLMSVIFGHDSKRGLQLGKYSYGVDSGCVRGGQLTALIVEATPNRKRAETNMVGVECRSAGRAAENEDDF
ncbi:ser thr protein phosphatase family [Zalerion maritima]|uniref:Ser thr protein phosphatase family n=1 Tax=Zalerion maritima TaxID=339359 RepID=A0AAD5WRI5_9PEZI|nr:ser thr protein phosphatase family [Zalerion maritima]